MIHIISIFTSTACVSHIVFCRHVLWLIFIYAFFFHHLWYRHAGFAHDLVSVIVYDDYTGAWNFVEVCVFS